MCLNFLSALAAVCRQETLLVCFGCLLWSGINRVSGLLGSWSDPGNRGSSKLLGGLPQSQAALCPHPWLSHFLSGRSLQRFWVDAGACWTAEVSGAATVDPAHVSVKLPASRELISCTIMETADLWHFKKGRKYRAGEGRPWLCKYLLMHNAPATVFQGLGEEGVACCWLWHMVAGAGGATSGLPAAGRRTLSAKQKLLCWRVILPCLTHPLPAASHNQGCAAGPLRVCLSHLPGPSFPFLGLTKSNKAKVGRYLWWWDNWHPCSFPEERVFGKWRQGNAAAGNWGVQDLGTCSILCDAIPRHMPTTSQVWSRHELCCEQKRDITRSD